MSARLDEQLCFPLYAASRAVTRCYTDCLAPVGLTYPQYLAMLVLWEDGETSVGVLGSRLRLDTGTLTPLIKRLELRGLVERRRDPRDERRVLVRPTRDGARLHDDVEHVPDVVRAACGLDDDEVDDLKAVLERLVASVEAAQVGGAERA